MCYINKYYMEMFLGRVIVCGCLLSLLMRVHVANNFAFNKPANNITSIKRYFSFYEKEIV